MPSRDNFVGSITTIIGPMFSGKTTEFIRLIDRKRIAGKKCLIIKHGADNRFDTGSGVVSDKNHVTTHSEIRYQKCNIVYHLDVNLIDVSKSIIGKYDVVGVEEGFFFKGISRFCNELANSGIDVIVATIESSYKQELFPEIGELVATSETVIKLNAVCIRCKNLDAAFTIRTIDNDAEILVGGSDIYQSVCRGCLIKFRTISVKK